MKCPYCGGEMRDGLLQGSHPFFWGPERRDRFLYAPRKKYGEFDVSEGLLTGSYAPAAYCEACQKIIISMASNRDAEN